MSMWRLRWHLTNRFVTGAPHRIKVTICHTVESMAKRTTMEQCRLQVAAEPQQRRRRTNRRRKSIPRSSSSHWEGSITQRGASCGRYDQRRRWSTPETPTWTYVSSQVEGLSEVWRLYLALTPASNAVITAHTARSLITIYLTILFGLHVSGGVLYAPRPEKSKIEGKASLPRRWIEKKRRRYACTLYKYWLVPRATLKNYAPKLCNV